MHVYYDFCACLMGFILLSWNLFKLFNYLFALSLNIIYL